MNETLRGGDEETFLYYARILADTPIGHGFLPHDQFQLQTVVFALELKWGGFSVGALRVMQVGIALLGVLLLIAAVHDLAGPRAARVAAWVLALEPGSIFFNSSLHKEPLMVLASGLVVFGGTKLWRNLDLRGLPFAAAGGLIAVETRSYAGWFLVSGAVLVLLHASLRRLDRPLRAMPLVYAIVIAGVLALPTVVDVSSERNLRLLQESQDFVTDTRSASGANNNNLALESIDYSNRGAVVQNLPRRAVDVLTRPYPWQLANPSQQLGALGTLIALGGLFVLLRAAMRRRGEVLALTGPILYPMLFLLMAYALSAGNAGTGFRYRTHIVILGVAMLSALRGSVRAPVPAGTLPRPVELVMRPQGRPA